MVKEENRARPEFRSRARMKARVMAQQAKMSESQHTNIWVAEMWWRKRLNKHTTREREREREHNEENDDNNDDDDEANTHFQKVTQKISETSPQKIKATLRYRHTNGGMQKQISLAKLSSFFLNDRVPKWIRLTEWLCVCVSVRQRTCKKGGVGYRNIKTERVYNLKHVSDKTTVDAEEEREKKEERQEDGKTSVCEKN